MSAAPVESGPPARPGSGANRAFTTFVTGRLGGLVLGLAFQLAVVRALDAAAFADYAVALAVVIIVQSLAALGFGKVVSLFGTAWLAAGEGSAVRRLVAGLLAIRIGLLVVGAIALLGAIQVMPWLAPPSAWTPGLVVAVAVWTVAMSIQFESDILAQMLGLQGLARALAIGEPLARLAGLAIVVASGVTASAVPVVALSAATLTVAVLAMAVAIAASIPRGGERRVDRALKRDIAAVAAASHTSSIGALLMSPPAVRLVAAGVLATAPFAAFAFVQGLMMSLLRFTPGLALAQFVEPAVMAQQAAGDPERLQASLALVFKLDTAIFAMLAAGLIAAGPAVFSALTGGRFTGYDLVLPAMLPIPVLYGLFRSYETAAVAVGATGGLAGTAVIGALALGATGALAPFAPLPVLLAAPAVEVALRIALLSRALATRGVTAILDRAFALAATAVALAAGFALRAAADGAPVVLQLAAGAVAGGLVLAGLLVLRPFRPAEAAILARGLPRWAPHFERLVRP